MIQNEIERRYLLKRLPKDRVPDEILQISQWYPSDGWRYRRVDVGRDTTYWRTRKSPMADAILGCVEEEEQISQEELYLKASGSPRIMKTRRVYKQEGLKFEVDKFVGIDLTVLEIELKHEAQEFSIPEEIAKEIITEIITEITFLKGLSNRDLAE